MEKINIYRKQYGTTLFKGKNGVLAYVLNNEKNGERKYPVAFMTKKNGNSFGILDYNNLIKCIKKNTFAYEIIELEDQIKPYFDLDFTGENFNLDEYIKYIKDFLPNAELQISGCDRPVNDKIKHSYHIIVSNYFTTLKHSANILRGFAKKYGFDSLVYKNNQYFKCINQLKKDSDIPQAYISGSTTLSKHLIKVDFDENCFDLLKTININTIEYYKGLGLSNSTKPILNIDMTLIPLFKMPEIDYENYNNFTFKEKLNLLPNPKKSTGKFWSHRIIWCLMLEAKNHINFEEFWEWNKQKNDNAFRFSKYLNYWEDLNYKTNGNFIDEILLKQYPLLKTEYKVIKCNNFINIENGILVNDFYIDYNKIDNNILDKKYQFLSSTFGTGKTEYIIQHLLKQEKPSMLYISSRITLTRDIQGRLNNSGFEFVNYLNFKYNKTDINNFDLVICSIESINIINRNYDFVVIDESETIFRSFCGNCATHINKNDNLNKNWIKLKYLIQNAKKVFIMDALMTKLTFNYIKSLIKKNEEYTIINTAYSKEPRNLIELCNGNKKNSVSSMLLTKIINSLKNNEKIYIVVPFKEGKKKQIWGVDFLRKLILKIMNKPENDNTYIKCYNSIRTTEKNNLINIDEEWGNHECRCIITNNCISVGVNYNIPDIFDKIYGVFCDSFIPIQDFLQSLYRIRKPICNDMYFIKIKIKSSADFLGENGENINKLENNDILFKKLRLTYDLIKSCNENDIIFNKFINKSNIKYSKENLVENAFSKLPDNDFIVYNYDNIKKINNIELYNIEIKKNNLLDTYDENLQLEKYYFIKKFKKDTDEDIIKDCWNYNRTLTLMIYNYFNSNENSNIIKKILNDNKVELWEDLSEIKIKNLTLDEIKVYFKLKYNYKKIENSLFKVLINSYFRKNIIFTEKNKNGNTIKKKNNCVSKVEYKTNEKFSELVFLIKDHLRIKNEIEIKYDSLLIDEESCDDALSEYDYTDDDY